MTGKLLIARIEKAFEEVRREGGITLPEARLIERGGSEAEQKKAREAGDKRWQEVPAATIEKHADALGHLDPKGFRFYLPAYMRWSLQNLKSTKTDPLNSAIYALSPSANPEIQKRNQERWAMLSAEQGHVIFKFLRFMVGQYDSAVDAYMAQLALEAHWKKFKLKQAKGG